MLDARFVRDSTDAVRTAMAHRGSNWSVDSFLELDEERRGLIAKTEARQAKRNEMSRQVGELMKAGKHDEAEALKAQVRLLNEEMTGDEAVLEQVEADVRDMLMTAPNLPHSSVPVGADEDSNVEVRRWGTPRDFGFEPQAHWDLGPALGSSARSSTSSSIRTPREGTRSGGHRYWPTPRR
jgi:seryl-tRNA synthetase